MSKTKGPSLWFLSLKTVFRVSSKNNSVITSKHVTDGIMAVFSLAKQIHSPVMTEIKREIHKIE